MKNRTTRRICLTALMAAIIYVFTAYIHVPSHTGYTHVGDGFLYLAASLLPAPFAAAAGAIGAGLADLLSGYGIWAPGTVIIKVLNLQQKISDEMEQEHPSEERIATLLCEIAGQLYKETNAKTQIAAQIARKRASLMKLQDTFNAAFFSELINAVSLHVGGGVVLHTKTETDICESEDKPNGSPENSETDSFRN